MPILDVRVVGEAPAGLARALAEAAGEALEARPGGTWVTVTALPAECYAESAGGPPPGVQPVFVSVLERSVPSGDALAERVARLTSAIAGACGRPAEHVHVRYEAAAQGRQAFGGKLVD